MKRRIFILLMLVVTTTTTLLSQTLTLEVRGIEHPVGNVYVAVYNSQELFMKQPIAAFGAAVRDSVLTIPCQGLPTGEYALSLFQDENDNKKLDTAVMGIPTEKYGFSNNAVGVMGPPPYKKCSFTLRRDTILTVWLK
jgi:uncharacterized protein (DUF2141 family)